VKKSRTVESLKRWATWAEIASYVSDSALSAICIARMGTKLAELDHTRAVEDTQPDDCDERRKKVKPEKDKLQKAISEHKIALTQNCVDFLMALDEIARLYNLRSGPLGDPRILSTLGLISACIGVRSKWAKC